jgi:O-antigen ligase
MQSWLMADVRPQGDRVAAPFFNPDHLATYCGVGALCSLALLLDGLTRNVIWDRGRSILLRTLLQTMTGSAAVWFVTTIILLAALLLSQSRGGAFAFLAGAIALSVGLAMGRRGRAFGDAGRRRIVLGSLISILAIAAWVGAEPLLGRLEGEGNVLYGRKEFAVSTIDAIRSAPLLGLGFGAFERYYPFFSDGTIPGDVDKAHDDYLEIIADLGIPAGLAFLAAPLVLGVYCAGGCVRRRRGQMLPAAGMAATVLVGTQAFVEFGLQIPAVAVTYAAILGVGTAQAWSSGSE